MQNPVLDQNKPESLSKEEIEFIINHIADQLPEEFEHMAVVLRAIKEGKCTRDALNTILKEYYMRFHRGISWSNAVVNTMRSGLLSRLNEMRFIKREKLGQNIRYHVTGLGDKYLQKLQPEGDVKQDEYRRHLN